MAKFVELHYITTGSLLVNCEQIRMVETIKGADRCKVLVGDIPAATSFYAKESYEEVKKLLLGAEPQRVLLVVENIVKHQPQIGKAALRTRQTDAMRAALAFHRDHLLRQRQHDDEKYLCENSLRHDMTAGFYRGRVSVEEEVLDWLERMVRDA